MILSTAFAALLIFAGQSSILADAGDESSVGKIFDQGFLDFIEETLGLKVKSTTVKPTDLPEVSFW